MSVKYLNVFVSVIETKSLDGSEILIFEMSRLVAETVSQESVFRLLSQ